MQIIQNGTNIKIEGSGKRNRDNENGDENDNKRRKLNSGNKINVGNENNNNNASLVNDISKDEITEVDVLKILSRHPEGLTSQDLTAKLKNSYNFDLNKSKSTLARILKQVATLKDKLWITKNKSKVKKEKL